MGLPPQSAGIWLEKSVKAAEKIGEKTIDKCYEADISYQRVPANTMMLWEVKPTTYLAKRWLYNKTNEKYEKMLRGDILGESNKIAGNNRLISYIDDIPVAKGLFSDALGIPEIYMNVFPSSFNEGIVYYSLYIKKKRPGYEFEKVYVSNADAKKAINEKNKELGRVAAATLLGGLGMNTAYAIERVLGVGQLPDSVMLPQGVF